MSVNDELSDRTLVHQIYLERIKAGESAELLRLFIPLEREILGILAQANLTSFRRERYLALLGQVRERVRNHYRLLRDTHQEKMEDLADLESTWTVRALNGALSSPVGVYIDVASISWSAEQFRAIASNATIENSPSRSYWAKQATDLTRRFGEQIKLGMLLGEPTDVIVARVRGTKKLNYTDGILSLSKAQARALVRSSIQSVAGDARRRTFEENGDLIKAIQQRSTLDSKTSIVCIAYSNKMWDFRTKAPIDHALPYKQGVPRHFLCRSAEIAVTRSFEELGGVPLRMADDKTIDRVFRQKLRDMGWEEERIGKAMRNVQSSMDGQVSADLDFASWLKTKGSAFQDEVLGKGKADLWRRGIIRDIDSLLSFDGNPLTLKQIREQFGVAL